MEYLNYDGFETIRRARELRSEAAMQRAACAENRARAEQNLLRSRPVTNPIRWVSPDSEDRER